MSDRMNDAEKGLAPAGGESASLDQQLLADMGGLAIIAFDTQPEGLPYVVNEMNAAQRPVAAQ